MSSPTPVGPLEQLRRLRHRAVTVAWERAEMPDFALIARIDARIASLSEADDEATRQNCGHLEHPTTEAAKACSLKLWRRLP